MRRNLKGRMILVCFVFMAALIALQPGLVGANGKGAFTSTFGSLTTAQITVNGTLSPDNTGAVRGVWGYLMASSDDFGASFNNAAALTVKNAVELEVARRGYANATIVIYPYRVRAASGSLAGAGDYMSYKIAPVTSLSSPDGVLALTSGGSITDIDDWVALSPDKNMPGEASGTYVSGTGEVKISNDLTFAGQNFDHVALSEINSVIAIFKVTSVSPTAVPTVPTTGTPTPTISASITPTAIPTSVVTGTVTPTTAPTTGPVPTGIPTPLTVVPTDPGVSGLTVVTPSSVNLFAYTLDFYLTPSQLGNLQMWNNQYYVKDSVVTSAFSASHISLSGTRTAFPVFQAPVTANSLNVFGFSLSPGSTLKVSQFPMVKVLSSSSARPFTLATSVAQLTSGEGRFAIAHNGVILGAETTLQPSLSYTILFSIRDNGNYDLDSTAGSILDPCVGVMSSTSSGGGGCSVALFPSAILLGVPAIFLFRKRK